MNKLQEYGINSYYEVDKLSEADQINVIVNLDDNAIKYIIDPSKSVQLTSVDQNSENIDHIKKPDELTQRKAIIADPVNICYIKNPCADIQILAVSLDPEVIQYIDKPCKKAQMLVVGIKASCYKRILNPCFEASVLAVIYDHNMLPYVPIEYQHRDEFILMLKLEHDYDPNKSHDKSIYDDNNPF